LIVNQLKGSVKIGAMWSVCPACPNAHLPFLNINWVGYQIVEEKAGQIGRFFSLGL